ncbi:MAG: DUF1573 domain-containing protein [Ferruginibacter sp.]
MFKYVFISFTALLLISCNVRNKKQIEKNDVLTKQIQIQDPTTVQVIDSAYNFGKVTEGEIVEFNYRFKNIGNKPLIVTNASASCGCTVPEKPEQPIQPGETGFIKVKFDSKNRVGNAHKTVTISSNAEPAFPELSLNGEVTEKNEN